MKQFTAEQLNQCSKEELIAHFLEMQQSVSVLTEQLAVANAARFGRKSEKLECFGQEDLFFNETEAMADGTIGEPEVEEVLGYKRKRTAGKRQEDLKNFPVRVVNHELNHEELVDLFGENGWKRLPDQVYSKLEMRPAVYEVLEHHIAVYAAKNGDRIVKAKHPVELLPNSIATPSVVAAVMNGKYTNALPLYRIEQEFARNDVALSRQTLANWMIRCTERYLSLFYDKLHEELCKQPLIQADETPVTVSKDGRASGSKSWMWLYRTGEHATVPPIILFDYQKTRASEHPTAFLKDFKGVLACDGFSVYHKMDRETKDITVANCWAHARRHFANAVKTFKGPNKQAAKKTLAYEALKQIGKIYAVDEEARSLGPEKHTDCRQQEIRNLVEEFFAWLKKHKDEVVPESECGKGFVYCLNQEKYLKVFLDSPEIPIDNSAAERAIRPFTIGRKNWQMIDTIHGAQSSAMIYSLVETAKANNLKPYEYLKHLLTEIPQMVVDNDISRLGDLFPWSPTLPEICKKKNTDK